MRWERHCGHWSSTASPISCQTCQANSFSPATLPGGTVPHPWLLYYFTFGSCHRVNTGHLLVTWDFFVSWIDKYHDIWYINPRLSDLDLSLFLLFVWYRGGHNSYANNFSQLATLGLSHGVPKAIFPATFLLAVSRWGTWEPAEPWKKNIDKTEADSVRLLRTIFHLATVQ